MRCLIDTHILLWAAIADPRLHSRHREFFSNPENDLLVSVVSLWEISIKYSLGKLPLPIPPRDFFAQEVATRSYEVLDLRRAHAERVAELPYIDPNHRDPFDRMLIAQALTEGLSFLSADTRMGSYSSLGLRLL